MTALTARDFQHDGITFRAFTAGTGAPVVFLHGGGSRASNFRAVMTLMSADFQVIAYDMRGFGETGAPLDREITHQHWADDVLACLDHFGLPSAYLVGWSLGATVALNFASQHPGRVGTMALLGAPHPDRPVNRTLFERRLGIIAQGGSAADVVAETFGTISQALSPWTLRHRPEALEQVRQEHLSHDVALAAKVVDGYASRPDLHTVLPRVHCPVTLVVGDADKTCDLAGAETLAGYLADATIQIVADCGHYYAVEQPAAVAQLLTQIFTPGGRHV
jgi:3-oxoadipate enol-lactonase